MSSKHKADLSYHCAWSEFYLELHMLLQSPLKARCWRLASLGPLTINRGAILSPHCLLWPVEVKRQKCEIMNECLAVYLSFPCAQLDWESAPDAIQAFVLKAKRGLLCSLEWPHQIKGECFNFQTISRLILISVQRGMQSVCLLAAVSARQTWS